MNGRVLVTGATGFIGRRVAELLVSRGRPVRLLVRREEALSPELRSQVEVIRGDLGSPDTLARATSGVGSVIHLAGLARAWVRDRREFDAVNVRGLGNLLDAARKAGVGRVVHVSSILVEEPSQPAPFPVCNVPQTPYERTKRAGESLVAAYAAEGHEAMTVLPTRVYGPGPLTDANTVTRAIALYLSGRLRLLLADGGVRNSYVHVDDAAMGIVLAESRGAAGGRYPLGGENASFAEVLGIVSELMGVRRHTISVPPRGALMIARASELWGRMGGSTLIPRGWVRVLLEDRPVDSTLSMQALGYAPRPLRSGLEGTLEWLLASRLRTG